VEDAVLSYHPSTANSATAKAQSIDVILAQCGTYSFPEGSPFVPDKLEISQRNKSRDQNDKARLCVLDKSRLHYKVFTVPDYGYGLVVMDEDVSMT
jgi:hypothetical protein